jgi:hypothetical protein
MIRIFRKAIPPENLKRHGFFLKELLNDLYALGAAVHQMNHSNAQPFWVSAYLPSGETQAAIVESRPELPCPAATPKSPPDYNATTE